MLYRLTALAGLAALSAVVQARKVTVANLCKASVWAAYNGMNSNGITVNGENVGGMWQQSSGQEDVLEIPENWATGRIWPATGCNDAGTDCMVGGCNGGKCDGSMAGQTGATLAEFTFDPQYETYDISIVDGYSVPMAIIPKGGQGDCEHVTCGVKTDILTVCDPSLAYPHGGDEVWSCFSPCAAGVEFASDSNGAFDFTTAPVCCPSNDFAQCPTSTIPFYDVYKPLCNRAFLYAPDPNGNVACNGPEYRIEFCPGGKGAGANPSGVKPVAQCAGGEISGGGVTGTNDDGGGSSGSGIPEGAGQACDAGNDGVNGGSSSSDSGGTGDSTGSSDSDTSSGSSNDNDEEASGSSSSGSAADDNEGSSQATQAASGSGGGSATADTGAATGAAASGAAAASEAGYWGTSSAAAGGSTAAAGSGASDNTVSQADTAVSSNANTASAANGGGTGAASTAAASATPCRGRGCRGQNRGGGRGGPGRKKRVCSQRRDRKRTKRLMTK